MEKRFYAHLCDVIFESLKNFSITEKMVRERMVIENPEVVDKFTEQGRHVIIAGGHYNNWELYALAMPIYHKAKGVAIYKKLHDPFFDRKMRLSREKYGLKMIPMREAKENFEDTRSDTGCAFILGGDQSPKRPESAYWMEFLNQDTGVLFGAEKYAKQYDLPVIYGEITKVKRGYFTVRYSELLDSPGAFGYGKITEAHTRALEATILKDPAYWLWSHKRWKHKRPKNLDPGTTNMVFEN